MAQNDQKSANPDAFALIDLLDGFFELRKRSPTLHGDAPVRAVQACPPFAEGSAFGWEIRYSGIALAIQGDAEPAVDMVDEVTPGFDYQSRIQQAANEGLLAPNWAQQLGDNWWWRDPQDAALIHTWTGLLVKPKAQYRLRVTELFNSPHLQLRFVEQSIADSDAWTPLILSSRLSGIQRTAISGSVACLSLLPARSRLQVASLAEHPWVGERTLAYYRPDYYQEKLTAPPTRRYAKLLRRPDSPAGVDDQPEQVWSTCDALVLTGAAAEANDVRTGALGNGPQAQGGPSEASATDPTSAFAELSVPADIQLLYLGRGLHVTMGEGWHPSYLAAKAVWEQLYGAKGGEYLDNATYDGESCVHPTPGHPVLVANVEPLVRFATRPGWSLLFEGATDTLPWGLRGIIRSSIFHSGALAFQLFDQPQNQVIPAGTTLGRCWPIPDKLQQAGFTRVPWQAAAEQHKL